VINIQSLRNFHASRPGAVLGGGPSLQADAARIPKHAVKIAVNHHALAIVRAQFMVFWDDPARNATLALAARSRLAIRVSPLLAWSDVDLSNAGWWKGQFSSHLATWFACWMGCDPVLLCGMDCYQGERPPDADPRDYAYQMPLAEQLDGWREALTKCYFPHRIKAVGGPLITVFGEWEKNEQYR
jgi:hypothetical protein